MKDIEILHSNLSIDCMKVLTCPCGAEIRGETENEVMERGIQHGKEVHPAQETTPEQLEELRKMIRDE